MEKETEMLIRRLCHEAKDAKDDPSTLAAYVLAVAMVLESPRCFDDSESFPDTFEGGKQAAFSNVYAAAGVLFDNDRFVAAMETLEQDIMLYE